MHVSAEGTVVVADVVKSRSHGNMPDFQVSPAQQFHAHADAVKVDIFHGGHAGHGLEKSAQMSRAHMKSGGQIAQRDGAVIVFADIFDHFLYKAYPVIGRGFGVFFLFPGVTVAEMPQLQELCLDQQLIAEFLLEKELPDFTEQAMRPGFPDAV